MASSWLLHELFTSCSHVNHDLFVTCSWIVHNLYTTYSRLVHNLFVTFSWIVQTCSWLLQYLFITSPLLVHDVKLAWVLHNSVPTCFYVSPFECTGFWQSLYPNDISLWSFLSGGLILIQLLLTYHINSTTDNFWCNFSSYFLIDFQQQVFSMKFCKPFIITCQKGIWGSKSK